MASNAMAEYFAAPKVAKGYSAFEHVTGVPAVQLLEQAGLVPTPPPGVRLLDNAGGTGVLSAALLETLDGAGDHIDIVCGDRSPGMLEAAEQRFKERGWKAETRIADGLALPFPDEHFTHVLTNFGFQSFPDPELGIKESIRVAAPGGTIGMTFWTLPGWMPAFRRALSRTPGGPDPALIPDTPRLTPEHAAWDHDPEAVGARLAVLGGVEAIRVEPFEFAVPAPGAGGAREEAQALMGLLGALALAVGWTEAERAACAEGGRFEAELAGALEEGGAQVWRSLVVTCGKPALA